MSQRLSRFARNVEGLFVGRINRLQFFFAFFSIAILPFMLLIFIPYVVAIKAFHLAVDPDLFIISIITLGAIVIVILGGLHARRLHDMGVPGWIVVIPFAGQILFLISLFVPGEKATNRFGSPPKEKRTIENIIFNIESQDNDAGETWVASILLTLVSAFVWYLVIEMIGFMFFSRNAPSTISSLPISSTCESLPTSLEANTESPLTIIIPSNNFVKVHVDQNSVAEVKTQNFAQTSPGCENVSIMFYTNTLTSDAYISILGNDKEGATYEISRIPVLISNHYDYSPSPELVDINPNVISSLTSYLQKFWKLIVVREGDLNGDEREDYAIAVELPYVTYDNQDKGLDEKNDRRLLVFVSQSDGGYIEFLNLPLQCRDCAGVSFLDGADLSVSIENDAVTVEEMSGSNWRSLDKRVFSYRKGSASLKLSFESHEYFWIMDPDRTRDYSETIYNKEDMTKFTRSFNGTAGISPKKEYKDVQLRNFAFFPEFFASTTYDRATYFLVPYFRTHDEFEMKELDITNADGEGAMLLRDGKVVWETHNYMEYADPTQTRFEDVTKDGIDEVIVVEASSLKPTLCNYYFYSWNNGAMNLLSREQIKYWPKLPSGCQAITSS